MVRRAIARGAGCDEPSRWLPLAAETVGCVAAAGAWPMENEDHRRPAGSKSQRHPERPGDDDTVPGDALPTQPAPLGNDTHDITPLTSPTPSEMPSTRRTERSPTVVVTA